MFFINIFLNLFLLLPIFAFRNPHPSRHSLVTFFTSPSQTNIGFKYFEGEEWKNFNKTLGNGECPTLSWKKGIYFQNVFMSPRRLLDIAKDLKLHHAYVGDLVEESPQGVEEIIGNSADDTAIFADLLHEVFDKLTNDHHSVADNKELHDEIKESAKHEITVLENDSAEETDEVINHVASLLNDGIDDEAHEDMDLTEHGSHDNDVLELDHSTHDVTDDKAAVSHVNEIESADEVDDILSSEEDDDSEVAGKPIDYTHDSTDDLHLISAAHDDVDSTTPGFDDSRSVHEELVDHDEHVIEIDEPTSKIKESFDQEHIISAPEELDSLTSQKTNFEENLNDLVGIPAEHEADRVELHDIAEGLTEVVINEIQHPVDVARDDKSDDISSSEHPQNATESPLIPFDNRPTGNDKTNQLDSDGLHEIAEGLVDVTRNENDVSNDVANIKENGHDIPTEGIDMIKSHITAEQLLVDTASVKDELDEAILQESNEGVHDVVADLSGKIEEFDPFITSDIHDVIDDTNEIHEVLHDIIDEAHQELHDVLLDHDKLLNDIPESDIDDVSDIDEVQDDTTTDVSDHIEQIHNLTESDIHDSSDDVNPALEDITSDDTPVLDEQLHDLSESDIHDVSDDINEAHEDVTSDESLDHDEKLHDLTESDIHDVSDDINEAHEDVTPDDSLDHDEKLHDLSESDIHDVSDDINEAHEDVISDDSLDHDKKLHDLSESDIHDVSDDINEAHEDVTLDDSLDHDKKLHDLTESEIHDVSDDINEAHEDVTLDDSLDHDEKLHDLSESDIHDVSDDINEAHEDVISDDSLDHDKKLHDLSESDIHDVSDDINEAHEDVTSDDSLDHNEKLRGLSESDIHDVNDGINEAHEDVASDDSLDHDEKLHDLTESDIHDVSDDINEAHEDVISDDSLDHDEKLHDLTESEIHDNSDDINEAHDEITSDDSIDHNEQLHDLAKSNIHDKSDHITVTHEDVGDEPFDHDEGLSDPPESETHSDDVTHAVSIDDEEHDNTNSELSETITDDLHMMSSDEDTGHSENDAFEHSTVAPEKEDSLLEEHDDGVLQ